MVFETRNVSSSTRLSVGWSMLALLVCVVCASLSASGCARTQLIPGTKLPDTDVNREIVEVIERYRVRMMNVVRKPEDKGVEGLLVLASKNYFEDSGTPRADDNYGYDGLGEVLADRLARVTSIRYEIEYLGIDVRERRAKVMVFIDGSFEVESIAGNRYRQLTDHHRFELVKEDDGKWRFLSGM